MGFVVYLSLLPARKLPRKLLRVDDFYLHALIHAVFVFLAVAAWNKFDFRSPVPRWVYLGALSVSFVFGSLMEFLQSRLTTYRSASLQDVMANSIGALVMVLAMLLLIPRLSKSHGFDHLK
jgi:VanZ family protein